jgi:hypothetical protein
MSVGPLLHSPASLVPFNLIIFGLEAFFVIPFYNLDIQQIV